MKSSFVLSCALFLSSLVLAGCQADDDAIPVPVPEAGADGSVEGGSGDGGGHSDAATEAEGATDAGSVQADGGPDATVADAGTDGG